MNNNSPVDSTDRDRKEETTKESQLVVIAQQTVEQFSGPIPPPNALAAYEVIQDGLADRIMKMAEGQSEHRRELEKGVIGFDKIKSLLGLIFAFLIVVIAITAGVYLTLQGQPFSGGIFSFIPLGTIVTAFIYQQRASKKDK